MSHDIDKTYWCITRSLPLRSKGRDYWFVQDFHYLYCELDGVDNDNDKMTIYCCDSGAGDRRLQPPAEYLRRMPGLNVSRPADGIIVLRGQADIEGRKCDIEMITCAESGRLYGSIEAQSGGSDDDDATGMWTAEDDGVHEA